MSRRLAYLCLQATTEGQASHAHVHEIIDGLEGLGWQVDLYEPSYAGTQAPGPAGRLIEFARVQRRLTARLGEYDAVYIRGHALAYRAARAAKRVGVPVIQECNGTYEDLFYAWPAARAARSWFIARQREQFEWADALIAVTPELAAWLTELTAGHPAHVVPNGANVDLFHPDAPLPDGLPEHYALFFGALAPWQGISTVLEALDHPAWPAHLPLVVAGDGAAREQVEASRAHYLGRVAYRELPGIVAGALVSLVPMHMPDRDRLGLAPLKLYESMAAGAPVIVSAVGGMDALVEECGCGIAVPSGDAAALAGAVAGLDADPEAARRMGSRGHEVALAKHSWAARAADTGTIIDEAIATVAARKAGA